MRTGGRATPYRHSRCTNIENAPQKWHWAAVEGDPKKVWRELVQALSANVHRNAVPDLIGDVKAIFERIEACKAVDPDHIKNITRNRDLWEVRFQLDTWGLVVRIYETEIPELPEHVVALLSHQKVVDVGEDEIADLQNEQIDEATTRWIAGRTAFWGIM